MLKNGYPRENTKIYEKRLSKDKEEILTEYLGVKCTNCDIMIANEPDEIGTWKPNIRRTK